MARCQEGLSSYGTASSWYLLADNILGISEAYQVLKNPVERKKYDKTNPGEYTAPDINVDDLYQEEFSTNAFGDDSASESGGTDNEDGVKHKIKPSDAHKRIYNAATPFIQKVLSRPPKTDAEKQANREEVKALNKKITEQNKKDGLEDESQCQISYVIFESTALLAAPFVERLEKNPKDSKAQEWIDYHDSSLKMVNRQNGYPNVWTLEASIFSKDKSGKPSPQGKSTDEKKDSPAGGRRHQNFENRKTGTGTGSNENQAPGTDYQASEEPGMNLWKPGYTLYGEKIIAYIPRERTIRRMEKGVRQPAEKVTFGYQFIVKDEKAQTIALASGQEVGWRATEGYLSLPKEEIRDARYSEKRYSLDDIDRFERLIDFASNPFQTRSSDEPRHPPGYGLVEFKDGTEDVLSRAGLRSLLGVRDADWEIQECEKRHGRIPAWKIEPLGWREQRRMTIEAPTKRSQRQREIRNLEQSDSDTDTLFVDQKRHNRRAREEKGYASGPGPARYRGRDISRRPAKNERRAARSVASTASRSSQDEKMAELKNAIENLTLVMKRAMGNVAEAMDETAL